MAATTFNVVTAGGTVVAIGAYEDGSSNFFPYKIGTDGAGNYTPAMDAAARAAYVYVTNGTQTQPTLDANARFGYVGLSDGTHGPVAVKAASTGAAATDVALVVRPLMGTNGTQTMPTGDAAARTVYVTPNDGTRSITVKAASTLAQTTDTSLVVQPLQATDGTNVTPIQDNVARPGFQKITDGTGTWAFDNSNTTPKISNYGKGTAAGDTAIPAGDTQAHGLNVITGDGTTANKNASLANLQAYTGTNALTVSLPGQDVATASIVTGTATPSAVLSAPGAGKIFNVHTISISLAATANQAPLLFELVQDAAGTPLVLWSGALAALANTSASISLTGLSIPQTVANKTLTLSAVTGTIVSTNYITCSMGASVCA